MGAWLILAAVAGGIGGALALVARWLGPEDGKRRAREVAIAEHWYNKSPGTGGMSSGL